MQKLTGGSIDKVVRLNPYKRIKKGTEVEVFVNGQPTVAITDSAGKYTYLTVDDVEYYITGTLEAGAEYATEEHVPAPAKPKAAPAEGDADAEDKPKRSRKAKAEEGAAAAA